MTLRAIPTALISLAIFIVLIYHLKQNSHKTSSLSFFLIGTLIWNIGYTIELTASNLDIKIIWQKIQVLGIAICTISYLRYMLGYLGLGTYLKALRFSVLSIIPVLILVLSFTNQAHALIWQEPQSTHIEAPSLITPSLGLGTWLWLGMLYLISIIILPGIGLILRNLRSGGLYNIQTHLHIILAVLPLIAVASDLIYASRGGNFSLTSSIVALSGITYSLAFPKIQKTDLINHAYKKTILNTFSGVLILDQNYKIIYVSELFEQTFGLDKSELLNHTFDIFAKKFPHFFPLTSDKHFFEGYSKKIKYNNQHFQADSQTIMDDRGYHIGFAITIKDITEQIKLPQDLRGVLDITKAVSETISLESVLLNLAKQLVKISNFSNCVISEWDPKRNATVALAEYSNAIWPAEGGDRYEVEKFPSTQKVLRTKQPIIIQQDADEAVWMEEQGWKSLLMLPLIAEDQCIGLVEVGNSSIDKNFLPEDITKAERVIAEAQRWLKVPYQSNPPELVLELATSIKETLGCNICTISEWKPEKDLITTQAEASEFNWPPETGPVLRRDEASSSAEFALQKGLASVIHYDDRSIPANDRLDLEKWNAQTLVAFPLNLLGERIGLIELYQTQQKTEVDPEMLLFWNTLADKAGFAIQNARLHQLTEKNLHHHVKLLEVVNTLSSSLEIAEILHKLAQQIAEAIDVTSAYFVNYDFKNKTSTVVAEYVGPLASPKEKISDLGKPYKDGKWLDENVDQDSIEVIHYDDPDIPEKERKHYLEYGGKSIILVPLFAEGKLIGHTELWESRKKRQFTEAELKLSSAITQQAGIVIENALLYEKAKREIADHKKTQSMLKESEKYYRGLFENAHDAIILFDPTSNCVLDVNDKACELYGYEKEEFININLVSITENIRKREEYIEKVLADDPDRRLEIIQYKKDGTKMFLEVNASLIEYNHRPAVLSIRRDITSRKMIEEKLRFAALHDALTNLPNRTLFLSRLNHAISTKKRNPNFNYTVIFLDLDSFKNINDVLGHSMGDKYIQSLSIILKQTLRETDMIARFGGDEFVILVEGLEDQKNSYLVCKRILELLNSPIEINGNFLTSTASIGVVIGCSDYETAEEIIRDADIAMYKAKEKGGNTIEIFDDQMREKLLKQIQMEADLENALERNEFSLYYQPIISLKDGSIFGIEALLRWKKSNGDIISPGEFIPLIEKSGLINGIGEWVLHEAITKVIEWKTLYSKLRNLTLSVNISTKQLEHMRFSDNLLSNLKKYKLDTGSLSIEVTESTIIQDIENTSAVLDALKQNGMQIFLDDFGTGYSSLNYLANLPISVLKIDRAFANNVTKTRRLNLLSSMINLGHELGMKVVAEGIETREQLAMLRKMGCDYGQGYFIQRPTEENAISKILEAGKVSL